MSIYHEKHARVLLNLPHQLIVEKMVPELLVKYFILTRVDGLSGLDENEFFNPGLPQSSRPRGTRSRRSATDPPTSIPNFRDRIVRGRCRFWASQVTKEASGICDPMPPLFRTSRGLNEDF